MTRARSVVGLLVLLSAAGAVGLALTLAQEQRLDGYDTMPGFLAVDAAAAMVLAGVCVWALRAGRAGTGAILVVAVAGCVLLADALVGSSVSASVMQRLGAAAAPLLPALLAFAPQAAGVRVSRGVWRAQVALGTAGMAAATCTVTLRDPFRELDCHRDCADNPLLVAAAPWLADAARWVEVGVAAAAAAILVRLAVARRGSRVVLGGSAAAVALTVARLAAADPAHEDPALLASRLLHVAAAVGVVVVAMALAYELSRVPRSRARLNGLLRDLRTTSELGLERCLQVAVGDPTLRLLYRHPRTHVEMDRDGQVGSRSDGAVEVELLRDGVPVATVCTDAGSDVSLGDVISPAAALALDNERLAAATRRDLHVLEEASATLVELGDTERRRIERNLHDGAQQRLVGVGLNLRLAALRAPSARLEAAMAELTDVIARLRGIAHGIHPATLDSEGLPSTLEALADDSPLAVELRLPPSLGRFAEPVEVTVYAVVQEALANAAAAGAGRAQVELHQADDRLTVDVVADGPGGARLVAGGGLEALHDRAIALGGQLDLTSPLGGPTRIHVAVPVPGATPGTDAPKTRAHPHDGNGGRT